MERPPDRSSYPADSQTPGSWESLAQRTRTLGREPKSLHNERLQTTSKAQYTTIGRLPVDNRSDVDFNIDDFFAFDCYEKGIEFVQLPPFSEASQSDVNSTSHDQNPTKQQSEEPIAIDDSPDEGSHILKGNTREQSPLEMTDLGSDAAAFQTSTSPQNISSTDDQKLRSGDNWLQNRDTAMHEEEYPEFAAAVHGRPIDVYTYALPAQLPSRSSTVEPKSSSIYGSARSNLSRTITTDQQMEHMMEFSSQRNVNSRDASTLPRESTTPRHSSNRPLPVTPENANSVDSYLDGQYSSNKKFENVGEVFGTQFS